MTTDNEFADRAAVRNRSGVRRPGFKRRVRRAVAYVAKAIGLVCLCYAGVLPALSLHPWAALLLLGATIACIVGHPWVLRERGKRWRATLRLRWIDWHAFPWIVAAAVAFAALNVLTPQLASRYIAKPPPPQPVYAFTGEPLGLLVLPLILTVMAPLSEELAMRGYLQNSLARTMGQVPALAISAIVFALIHGSLRWAPLYAFGGLVMGGAQMATRSFWAAVLVHVTTNGATMALVGRELPAWADSLVAGQGLWLVTPALTVATATFLVGANRARRRAPYHRRAPWSSVDPGRLSPPGRAV